MDTHQITASPDHLLPVSESIKKLIFITCTILCITPWISPAVALLIGIGIAQLTGHPYIKYNQQATHCLLQLSVIGLGFGMNAHSALQAGEKGILFTVASIFSTLTLGYFLGRWLKVDFKSSYLISAGTAICGGSAIAAISPVIKADEKQISVALGCIFILNAAALFIFPVIGHYFNLSQTQFGLWCAIAIHDTSSVVGASGKYGSQALEIATAIKLARALWIIPVALISTAIFKSPSSKFKIPYFIGWFVLAMLTNTYLPAMRNLNYVFVASAKVGLTLTLFFIGAGLSRRVLVAVGLKPLLQGLSLWLFISAAALYAVLHWA